MDNKHKNKRFQAREFTSTQHSTAEQKAAFANHFVRFVSNGFKRNDFTKPFYTRLSMTFGHIAHYNLNGFWYQFFETTDGKMRFIQKCNNWRVCGDPAYTYSDVERVLQQWIKDSGIFTELASKVVEEQEAAERDLKAHLEEKYPSTKGW